MSLNGEMYEFVCVVMGEQGGSFCCKCDVEEVGNGMEEREYQKYRKVVSEVLSIGGQLPGNHLAASRVTTWWLADPWC